MSVLVIDSNKSDIQGQAMGKRRRKNRYIEYDYEAAYKKLIR